jgi:hypothetical protein
MMSCCTCGHSEEEHGHDLEYPSSTSCHGIFIDTQGRRQSCECIAFEADDSEIAISSREQG